MENPGGGSGVGRMPATGSLAHILPPQIINPPPYHERYWWSWRRLQYLVHVVKSRGVENAGEWKRLGWVCRIVSERKRKFLYQEFKPLFSEASLEYLFGGLVAEASAWGPG